jgi:hypothetical protein
MSTLYAIAGKIASPSLIIKTGILIVVLMVVACLIGKLPFLLSSLN